jgi:phospholipid N-methyltransferase
MMREPDVIRFPFNMAFSKINLAAFAVEALTDFQTIGAVAPSSRFLAQAMLQPLRLEKTNVVVELGSGTGVMTQALLDLIPFDATLFAFEINPRFLQHLKSTVSDPRLVLINASAESIEMELRRRGYNHADAVVSSLALGFMSNAQRHALLSGIGSLLDETGVFTQYQYLHSLQLQNGQLKKFSVSRLLRQYFSSVQRRTIWRNLPPAFVFACRGRYGKLPQAHLPGQPAQAPSGL